MKPVSIESNDSVHPYIYCPEHGNINGSVYFDDINSFIVNESNVLRAPTKIEDGYQYLNSSYQVATLSGKQDKHYMKISEDCEFNYLLIGPGSCGGLASSTLDSSVAPGGASGGVVSGRLFLKKGDSIEVSIDGEYGVDTIKYMGVQKPYTEVKNNPVFQLGQTLTNSSVMKITHNNEHSFVVCGAPYARLTNPDPNATNVSTNGWFLSPEFNDNSDRLSTFVSSNYPLLNGSSYVQFEGQFGGMSKNVSMGSGSFGLASGYENESSELRLYPTVPIMDKMYNLPSGGGGGGSDTSSYSVNYNTTVNRFNLASQSMAGVGVNGGGYGNRIGNDEGRRLIDAWLPGAGGGGAFFGNRGQLYSNGVGGQGALLFWARPLKYEFESSCL